MRQHGTLPGRLHGVTTGITEAGCRHPDRHGDHHQVLRQRDETERHVAGAADAGAFQFTLLDIDRREDRHGADRADEERDRDRQPVERARHHQDAGKTLGIGIDVAVGHPALGEQVVIEEHGRKTLDILRATIEKAMNHSAALRVKGVPLTA